MNKTSSFLLALIIAATSITSFFSGVVGKELNPIYTGMNIGGLGPQEIKFSVFNGSVLYNFGNLSIEFYAHQGAPKDMQTLMYSLYSVSYNASWQDESVVIYDWSIHDPANITDDDPDPQQYFYYTLDLTNVPEGEHQIEVTAVGGGYIWGSLPPNWDAYYDRFTTTGSSTLCFTINASSPPAKIPDFDSSVFWKTNVTWNLSETPARDLWETDINYKGRCWNALTVVGDIVYAGSIATVSLPEYITIKWIEVYAFNATTGTIIWDYYGESSGRMTSFAIVDGVIYFGGGDHIAALNASNGKLLWKTTCHAAFSSPAVVNNMLFIGSSSYVIALNASNGQLVWNFTTGASVQSSPNVVNNIVYIGSNDANLYALHAENGEKIWTFTAGSGFSCVVAIVNGVVYAPSNDGYVYALNADTGVKLWSYDTTPVEYEWQKNNWLPLPSACPTSPYVDNSSVYFTVIFLPYTEESSIPGGYVQTAGDGWSWIFALNATDGIPIWNTTVGVSGSRVSSPVVVDGIVYARKFGSILGLDGNNGSVIWNYTAIELKSIANPIVVVNDVLYVGSGDDQVYALKTPFSSTESPNEESTEPPSEEPTETTSDETTEQVPIQKVIVACLTVVIIIYLLFYFKKRKH